MRIKTFAVRSLTAVFAAVLLGGIDVRPAESREIHYGAIADPRVIACDQLQWRGQLEASEFCFAELLQGDAAASIRAEAAWALGDLQEANRWFQQAMRETPNDAAARVRWGDLFAASHQNAEAMNIYREALQSEPNNAFAKLGSAQVLVGTFDDAANTYLEPLLSDSTTDDGARAGAWLLVARVALENGGREQALAAMEEAEAILTQHDWPPLELYALRAAADLLNNVTDSRWTALSLQYNPHFGGIYAIPAHFYVITRRYRDAINLYQKAVDIEPGLASAHEELGVNLLRDNQMSRARKHLESAHNEDPFSPKAVNTLRLLDSFANFRLVNDPELPGDPDLMPITLRLHKDEAAVIAPYAIRLTRDSIAEFTERYNFKLREPVVIEMYPDHEDFAVRTAGMPGIGILGATFGYVVAMDSPSGRPPEQFQWGTTLWHEMAHVFTLEASNHLVPRWFSEGVSVFEEWRSGPNPGVRIPMSVYSAIKDGRLLPVDQLDEGFMRPTYEQQVIVSYMQAGLVCQFIEQHYGAGKLSALLHSYGDGQQTSEAIEAVLGVTTAKFDSEFDSFLQAEHGAIIENLEEWHRTQLAIAERVDASDWQAAAELAQQLLALVPQYVEPDSPYLTLARANDELGKADEAMAVLEKFWRHGGYDPGSLKQLGHLLHASGRTDDAIDVLKSVNLVDPLDQDLHGVLGDLLLEKDRAVEALQEFTAALALDPHDKATAYYRMARAYHKLGDREQSQGHLLLALDVAPNFRPAQRLLLEIMRADLGNKHE